MITTYYIGLKVNIILEGFYMKGRKYAKKSLASFLVLSLILSYSFILPDSKAYAAETIIPSPISKTVDSSLSSELISEI